MTPERKSRKDIDQVLNENCEVEPFGIDFLDNPNFCQNDFQEKLDDLEKDRNISYIIPEDSKEMECTDQSRLTYRFEEEIIGNGEYKDLNLLLEQSSPEPKCIQSRIKSLGMPVVYQHEATPNFLPDENLNDTIYGFGVSDGNTCQAKS